MAFIQPRCSGRGLPERGALGCGDAVTFRVQVPSHLHSVAGFPLLYVLIHSGLQQVGILALGLPDSHYTLVCRPDKHGWVSCFHVGPHLLEHSDLRPLRARNEWEKNGKTVKWSVWVLSSSSYCTMLSNVSLKCLQNQTPSLIIYGDICLSNGNSHSIYLFLTLTLQ